MLSKRWQLIVSLSKIGLENEIKNIYSWMDGWARMATRLTLKEKLKVTRKWPI